MISLKSYKKILLPKEGGLRVPVTTFNEFIKFSSKSFFLPFVLVIITRPVYNFIQQNAEQPHEPE